MPSWIKEIIPLDEVGTGLPALGDGSIVISTSYSLTNSPKPGLHACLSGQLVTGPRLAGDYHSITKQDDRTTCERRL